ncbi:glycosyltransferase family 4 protein [Spirulina major CS-329]|uniref:glycosyltransferase family 4 protein n=1 Tax=Spirulina TaxID=1154 RepID=UPI00232D5CC2|nr:MULTISPECIES: glycosyltransferase family 4 protein [Spirulina]MDB9496365.1 glycosyltransferase family 4 protein [Spirulina subsalsa CS-330]MDB9501443.1 glycosyltransferase family 4 protein [Spirulina major CS-329]
MKVLHLSYSDLDGGACRGTYQLHKALQRIGVDSQMLVLKKDSTDPSVIGPTEKATELIANSLRGVIDRYPLRRYPQKKTYVFSPAIFPPPELAKIRAVNPDVINLHWINKGFLTPESLPKLGKPLVWTLQDMWSMTGGCHYSEGCDRFTAQCGACPLLGSTQEQDLSRKLWQRKAKAWANLDLHIVGVSQWVADCVRRSSLLHRYPVDVIGEAMDTTIFKPRPKAQARELLNLDCDRRYILFSALNPTRDKRKGFAYLQPALQQLRDLPNTELLILGTDQLDPSLDIGLPARYLGKRFDDLSLALAYNAADVAVAPSLEDACPKGALEPLACGVPVVSFDATGLKDIVEHQVNGYRAACFESEDLARGIQWVLDQEGDTLAINARRTVETRFWPDEEARQYLAIYEKITGRA